jgi:hypothetical protein
MYKIKNYFVNQQKKIKNVLEKRRFSKNTCLTKPIKGFTMKSSCTPYKDCIK